MIKIISVKTIHCTCDKPSCGYEWDKRKSEDPKELPKMCPKCKTYKWNSGGEK